MKYKSLPVEIEAIQWECSIESEEKIREMGCKFYFDENPDVLLIETLEGVMKASPWDYIIKGTIGEFYPCKPEVFERKYELVRE